MTSRGKRASRKLPRRWELGGNQAATLEPEVADGQDTQGAEQPLENEHARLRQLLSLHERDRQLLAYEIHDGLTQYITGAAWQFESFRELQQRDPEGAWQVFEAGLKLLRRSMEESRRLINGLRPAVLQQQGLVAAVEQLIQESEEQGDPEISLSCDLPLKRWPAALESSICRVVQECLTNARRHSQSRRACVRLDQQGDRIRVDIQDWGVGFALHSVGPDRCGLSGIRERAAAFGGRAVIDSAPGRGTRIYVEFPCAGESSEQSW